MARNYCTGCGFEVDGAGNLLHRLATDPQPQSFPQAGANSLRCDENQGLWVRTPRLGVAYCPDVTVTSRSNVHVAGAQHGFPTGMAMGPLSIMATYTASVSSVDNNSAYAQFGLDISVDNFNSWTNGPGPPIPTPVLRSVYTSSQLAPVSMTITLGWGATSTSGSVMARLFARCDAGAGVRLGSGTLTMLVVPS